MAVPRHVLRALVAASLMLLCGCWAEGASADDLKMATLQDMFAGLQRCWRPPVLPQGHPGMQITVMVSFRRSGEILGKPRITFESPEATGTERVIYRTAVMETLQHCTPLPFTGGLGDAVAGRPFTLRFDDRRNHTKPKEKQAWLITKTF
jgi:hypothetical protein